MTPAHQVITLNSLDDLTLSAAERIASGQWGIAFGDRGRRTIEEGHVAFQRFLAEKGKYVYGSTTAPGSRAKKLLTPEEARSQGDRFGNFITMRAGLGGSELPKRTVRLALLAQLTNALSGRGKISLSTAERIASLLEEPPFVPLRGLAGSGEVMALSWLLAPLAEAPLRPGEAMALVNGSPFSTAMVTDAALLSTHSLDVARMVLALSIEAARAPLDHYRPELGALWPDPFYATALERLNTLLAGACPDRLAHQAPVSWRIIPNILASAGRAAALAHETATVSLRAVKDNPTFLRSAQAGDIGDAVSSGGYHDHQAARSIEAVTVAYADLSVLIERQVARLVDGAGLGLPPLLVGESADGVGTEYFVWTLTEPLACARQAAVPAGLDLSLEDPGGNQSDVAQPIFVSYARHLEARTALAQCLAVLATVSFLALRLREQKPPPPLLLLWRHLEAALGEISRTSDAAAAPLRDVLGIVETWMGSGELE